MHKNTKEVSTFPNGAGVLTRCQAPDRGAVPSPPLPLGNYTIFASRTENPPKQEKKRLDVYRLLRYSKNLAHFTDRCRICQTPRHDFTNNPGKVEIRQTTETKKTSFANVYQCGAVWTCAVCARRSSRQRGNDVASAMEMHRLSGGFTYMATYTIQHKKYGHLDFTLSALTESKREMKAGRWYKYEQENILGTISGREVTYSDTNGWHPHTHDVIFTHQPMTEADIKAWKRRWCKSVQVQGMYAREDIGLDIRECFPSDYLAKFGADFEITGELNKNTGGLSPWQILELTQGRRDTPDTKKYADLWDEFRYAFKGRHRLNWTKGLKHHFGIGEMDDIDNVEAAVTVGEIDVEEYKIITEEKAETDFLEFVAREGFAAAYAVFFQERYIRRRYVLARAP